MDLSIYIEIAILIAACLAILIARPWKYLLVQRKPGTKHYTIHLDGSKYFAGIDEAEVSHLVHEKLQTATNEAVEQFRDTLKQTMPKLVDDVKSLHETEIQKEFVNYTEQFETLNQEVIDRFSQVQDDLMKRHGELAEALDKRVVADYKFRMSVFDERLNDVISGYVLESLGSHVDLGAQLPYILGKIDENKEQIKKDIAL
jgi:DNA-directed RNA polymerase subunit F